MIGRVTFVGEPRADEFKTVGIEFNGSTRDTLVNEYFEIAVGNTVEFDVDEDGDVHITEVLS